VHDRDGAFADIATTVAGMHVEAVQTAPRSPWQNAYIERLIDRSAAGDWLLRLDSNQQPSG